MALKLDVYKPSNKRCDLLIFFPYTWGGDRHNNKKLLSDLAMLTGGLVVGAQTPGTGQVYVNRVTRSQFQPGKFAGLASDYAGEVHEYLEKEGYPRRLLVAQSGRVALGARMQTSPYRPFTHTLFRDGTNLHAPESVARGRERLLNQPPAAHPTYPEQKSFIHRLRDRRSQLRGLAEMLTQSELQCSTESVEAMEKLARDPRTPVVHMTFKDGITGTQTQQRNFRDRLLVLRAGSVIPPTGENAFAPLDAAVRPGTHGDLQNPLILDAHINWALNLPRGMQPGTQEWIA